MASGTLGDTSPRKMRQGPPYVIDVEDGVGKNVAGKTKHWGYELLLDMSDCNEKVDDPKEVAAYLTGLVKVIKMTAVDPPRIHQFKKPGGRGTSGFQMITTSGIQFHSDNIKWQAYIDIFSCKAFEPKVAIKFTKKFFQPKHIGDCWIYRDAGPWPEK